MLNSCYGIFRRLFRDRAGGVNYRLTGQVWWHARNIVTYRHGGRRRGADRYILEY